MARIIKPPHPIDLQPGEPSLFLAGSIAMGKAVDWQAMVSEALLDLPLCLLNPRRDAWQADWVQDINNPPFREQVEWELAAQEQADLIAMYFDPQTQAPITLLELGLFARSGKVIVCCPDGFWRKGNVDIVCTRYGVEMQPSLPVLITACRRRLFAERI